MEDTSLLKRNTRKAQPPQILEREYGRYLIKAGILNNAVVARAFPKPPSKFRHLIAEASGDTPEDAIERLIAELEKLRSDRRSLRRVDPALAMGVPTPDEYADALRSLSPSPRLLGILHDHALSRRRGRYLADLARENEYSSVQDVLTAYEKLGTDILKVIEPDDVVKSGLSIIMPFEAGADPTVNNVGTLQPELQDAVLDLLGSERRSE